MSIDYGRDYPEPVLPDPFAGDALLAKVRDGKWLDSQNFPPLRYTVPGLIPEGQTLFVGPPKSGKSWAVLDVALATAAGGYALGHIAVGDPRPVFYLALEDGDRRLQDRCRALLVGAPIPERFEYLTRVTPDDVLSTIRAWLRKHPAGDALVILDTLGKVMPPSAPGESAYMRDYRIGTALKAVTDEHPGTSVVVVHHDRKAGAEDFIDSVSGTHGLAGAADTVVVLARARGDSAGLLKVTGRDVVEAEYAVTLSDGGSWQLAASTLTDAARAAAQQRATAGLGDRSIDVLIEVGKHPDGIGPTELGAAVKMPAAEAGVYLGRLVTAGRIVKAGRGKYAPLPTPVESVESVGTSVAATSENNTPNTFNGGSQARDDHCDVCGGWMDPTTYQGRYRRHSYCTGP
jgi:hypothetical protein